jgi:hypothetical protein
LDVTDGKLDAFWFNMADRVKQDTATNVSFMAELTFYEVSLLTPFVVAALITLRSQTDQRFIKPKIQIFIN